jgi:26S proteasome regulatory subunit N12
MAEQALAKIITQLRSAPAASYPKTAPLIAQAKIHLCTLSALAPTPQTPAAAIPLAREVFELGALLAIRAIGHLLTQRRLGGLDADEVVSSIRDAFARNFAQLRPFYELPVSVLYPSGSGGSGGGSSERNKVTGLYLLLLLTEGRYAEFHSELESLTLREWPVETDKFLKYPVRLERWLMEGSYDSVWNAMKSREVPCEEYGVFSDILTQEIRSEIASSSERAYPKLPISSTKSLLFLESEGAVVDFARQRGWTVRDGEIFFPSAEEAALNNADDDGASETSAAGAAAGLAGGVGGGLAREISGVLIENALGYARELETIV